jgi:hypothetical protein
MTMPLSLMARPPGPASTAGTTVSVNDIVGVITVLLGLLTVIAAGVALKYAKQSAKSADDSVQSLVSIAADMKNVAILQEQSLESARQLRLLELLSRQTSLLGEIVDTIATMISIPSEIASANPTGDPLDLADNRFSNERRKLLIALKMLPNVELPKCRTVASIVRFRDAFEDLKPAGEEADRALTLALIELEEEARKDHEGNRAAANPAVASEVLDRLRQQGPAFLERLVLSLLTTMGYGEAGAEERVGKVGAEGSDGVIRQDPLGVVRIYVQANRYGANTAVGQPEIEGFVKALQGARADGGIYITTSRFTPAAIAYAHNVAARVVLIDGRTFSDLIVRNNITL